MCGGDGSVTPGTLVPVGVEQYELTERDIRHIGESRRPQVPEGVIESLRNLHFLSLLHSPPHHSLSLGLSLVVSAKCIRITGFVIGSDWVNGRAQVP